MLKIFDQTINIKGVMIKNPQGFPKEILADIPLIHVNYDLGDLLQKKIHLKKLEVNLKKLTIIKNKNKQLNIDALRVAQDTTDKKEAKDRKKDAQEKMPMQIDVLVLSVGKITYKDYSAGVKPQIKTYDLSFKSRTYKNITSAQQLARLILIECLKETGIKSAKIYGAASLLGITFLPAGVALAITANDSVNETFNKSFHATYEASLKVLDAKGRVTDKKEETGILKAKADGNNIAVKLEKTSVTSTTVTVSARKFMLPKKSEAEKILYLIEQELKLDSNTR